MTALDLGAVVASIRATTDERPEPTEWFSYLPAPVRAVLGFARVRGGDVHSSTWDRIVAHTPSWQPHTDALVELAEWLWRVESLDCGQLDDEVRTYRAAEAEASALRSDCVTRAALIASLIAKAAA